MFTINQAIEAKNWAQVVASAAHAVHGLDDGVKRQVAHAYVLHLSQRIKALGGRLPDDRPIGDQGQIEGRYWEAVNALRLLDDAMEPLQVTVNAVAAIRFATLGAMLAGYLNERPDDYAKLVRGERPSVSVNASEAAWAEYAAGWASLENALVTVTGLEPRDIFRAQGDIIDIVDGWKARNYAPIDVDDLRPSTTFDPPY